MKTVRRTTVTTTTRITFTEEQVIEIIRSHLVAQDIPNADDAVIKFDVASQGFIRGAEAVIEVREVKNE